MKGKLDHYSYSGVALLPMGEGEFILALNQSIRKGIGKRAGAMLNVQMEEDKSTYQLNNELMDCLNDEPEAFLFFKSMPGSNQRYFSKWIEAAKTEPTKAKRIALVIKGGEVVDTTYHPDFSVPTRRPKLTRPLWIERELELERKRASRRDVRPH